MLGLGLVFLHLSCLGFVKLIEYIALCISLVLENYHYYHGKITILPLFLLPLYIFLVFLGLQL